MKLEIKPRYNEIEEIKELFDEYTSLLVDLEPEFKDYLELQNYDDEVDCIDEIYGEPNGRLYIAYVDHQVAGCIGLKRLDANTCEMKRLYVRPQFGGQGIGDQLVDKIISEAVAIGYQFMLLDTFPSLEAAIRLYCRKGFYEIPAYNNSPLENTVYMKLDLLGKETI